MQQQLLDDVLQVAVREREQSGTNREHERALGKLDERYDSKLGSVPPD
jgi:hypothetical protein